MNKATILFYIFEISLLYLAYCSFKSIRHISKHNIRFRDSSINVKKNIQSKDFLYNVLRFSTLIIILLYGFKNHCNRNFYFIIPILLILSTNKDKILYFSSPYYLLKDFIFNYKVEKLDKELLVLMVLIKNMALSMDNNSISFSRIIDTLIFFSKDTKKYFIDYLILMRDGQYEDAKKYFVSKIDTELANDLIDLLNNIRFLPLSEFKIQLDLIIDKKTSKNDEKKYLSQVRVSDMCFIPAILLVALIAINYMYIVFNLSSFAI